MNAGIAPGVTNLMATELLKENPDADDVELVFTVTTSGQLRTTHCECPGERTRNARTAAPDAVRAPTLAEAPSRSVTNGSSRAAMRPASNRGPAHLNLTSWTRAAPERTQRLHQAARAAGRLPSFRRPVCSLPA